MITTKNYFDKVKNIDYRKLPADLKERYDYVKEVTEDHTSWEFYNADADIKATVDQYLADLSDHLKARPNKKEATADEPTEADAREVAKKLILVYALRGDTVGMLAKSLLGSSGSWGSASIRSGKIHVDKVKDVDVNFKFPLHSIYNEVLEEAGKEPAAAKPLTQKPRGKTVVADPQRKTGRRVKIENAQPVERIDEAVRFIKRYALMHGKIKTDKQILTFINSLQKAILEKRIRKVSTFAKEIEYIQQNLIKLHNNMGREVEIRLQADVLERFLEIAGSEQVRLSVAYMKRYIGMQGKHIDKEKAKRLHSLISTAINKQKISKTDPYRDKVFRVLSSLKVFIDKAKPADTLQLHSAALNGINEALDGCCAACDEQKVKKRTRRSSRTLGDIPEPVAASPETAIMSSVDFAGMQFETLGFMGKWKEFMGDPAAGFTAMVSARPKMGKSYLCADFAGYLARHHGHTLFVAGEEKLGHTLQQKIDAVKHPCLHVTAALPGDLSPYDFIVLDSVSRLRLLPEDLRALKARYPGKSFIYVYQVTKAGKFRGSNEAQHDVDIVVEIPEKGKAVQFGRFNQGGEMDIFETESRQAA